MKTSYLFPTSTHYSKRGDRVSGRRTRLTLNPERLEERALLATNPVLVSIQPNVGQVLNGGDTRNIAPSELTFRFDSGQAIDPTTLSAIQIFRAGGDGILGTSDDVTVPASREVGPLGNDVILRFAENLPDDRYRALIRGTGNSPLRNLDGDVFDGNRELAGTQDYSLQFNLDLGTRISAVVPQPITRHGDGSLSQALDKIELYFNDDDLNPSLATNPSFYQLILTQDTVTNTDDVVFQPQSVIYNAANAVATLTFADDLHQLAGGAGTFRLRVGTAETKPPAPAPVLNPTDPGATYSAAYDVGTLTDVSQVIAQAIDPQAFPLNFPGNFNEPGHGDPFIGPHFTIPDIQDGVTVIEYNFDPVYGIALDGSPLTNLISEPQKQRVREAMEIYSTQLGVDVVETATSGLTIATGDSDAQSNDMSALVVLDNSVNWNNEFLADDRQGNPSYFAQAVRLIGSSLFFIDPGEIAPNLLSGDIRFRALVGETILPSDPALIHGRYTNRSDSIDIDMYRFQIEGTQSGLFSAEIFAERLPAFSGLDGVLRLYRESNGQFELLAQNDDYFSEDPYLTMMLDPGVYYVGVSSTGNDQYDPLNAASGIGGTSQGPYELRLDLRPAVTDSLADGTGVALDGDSDGVPGGTFNFWFRTAAPSGTETLGAPRIIYVDKADASPDTTSDVGTIANPYNILHNAFNLDRNGLVKTGSAFDPHAARAGDIVRIVGNGESAAASLPYRVGVDVNTNQPLADGAKFDIPRDVSVMVDAGAVIKLRRAAILVGSTAVTVDHSKAALQLLGTPDSQVLITSTNDLAASMAARGDWGGIVFAGDVDRAEQRVTHEDLGIFLNYVGQAAIRYGGGIVNIGSIPQAIAPINIRDARPTITYNSISHNGVAAVSATPDSFEETNFHAPQYQSSAFTSDFTRVGPKISDNTLADNTLNGLLVRTDSPTGRRRMTVAGRWDDADIVHVVTDVLEISGTPGGPLAAEPQAQARPDARLRVDPNVKVKLGGARIEVGLGAQLIAEGNDGQQVVFTSVLDDRFGGSGSFDTSNNQTVTRANRGDWGGIYIGHSSSASIDHASFLFGGGVSAVEGNFVGFNTIEIHQAKARVTNSIFADNSGGLADVGPVNREGRGTNAPGTIFIRGAQPIIVGNSIYSSSFTDEEIPPSATSANDMVPAITINASALTGDIVADSGRSTGPVSSVAIQGNQGPLIRQNRLQDNDINGLLVRGETLTTEGVWDDTDITHVLFDDIHVPNDHTLGGLRLESNGNESLVVKVGGYEKTAGFDATGRPLNIADRIGGALHVIGQPGHPVIITSLSDTSVGAGMKLDGSFQNQTFRPGFGTDPDDLPTGKFNINFNFSTEVESNPMLVAGLEEAARFWEQRLSDPITLNFDVVIARTGSEPFASAGPEGATFPYDEVVARMRLDAAQDERDLLNRLPSFSQLTVQFPPGDFSVSNAVSLGVPNAKALGYIEGVDFPITPSTTKVGATRDGQINVTELYERSSTVDGYASVFIHEIAHTMGFLSSVPEDGVFETGANTLTAWDLFRLEPGAGARDFTNSPRVLDPAKEQVSYDGGLFDPVGIDIAGITIGDVPVSRGTEPHPDRGQPSHWRSSGAVGMNGIVLGLMDPAGGNGLVMSNDERVLGLLGWDLPEFVFPTTPTPGDWQGIQLDEWAHDRNVDVHTELEVANGQTNSIPDRAEFLGKLATREYSSDENQRLGFQVLGLIDSVGEVDTYSFDAVAGTEVWLDIDRTSSSLDSVVELINVVGDVLARSDNSLAADQSSPSGTVTVGTLSKSGFYPDDFYSVNPADAGMRLILPGAAGTTGTYYVRVRSSSPDLANVSGGQTSGSYELGIRLREVDEVAGSTVQFADIRYAKNAISASGLGAHSVLQTEFVEPGDIADHETAFNLGNPYISDRGEISVSGTLEPIRFLNNDPRQRVISGIDWYTFNSGGRGVTIDVDYADGTGNADTFVTIWRIGTSDGEDIGEEDDDYAIYDLVYFGESSDIARDVVPGLSGGSLGPNDPFIGVVYPSSSLDSSDFTEVLLPDRNPDDNRDVTYGDNYLLAISSEAVRPQVLLDQYLFPDALNKNAKVDVTEWVDRTVVDLSTANAPFGLNDLTMYVSVDLGGGLSGFTSINPFTGEELQNGPRTLRDDEGSYEVQDLAMRADGNLFSLSLGMDDESSGNLLNIDWARRLDDTFNPILETLENLGDDQIVTFAQGDPDIAESNDGIQFQGMTFTSAGLLAVGNRGDDMAMGPEYLQNIVYLLDGYPTEIDGNDTDPGTALPQEPKRETDPMSAMPMRGAFTDIVELGYFNTGASGGTIQGLATVDGQIYGISSTGRLFGFTPGMFDTPGTTTPIGTIAAGQDFTGLSAGPEGLGMDNLLFGMTSGGRLYAFTTAGAPANVFNGANFVQTSVTGVTGIAFSTLDSNLWTADPAPEISSAGAVLSFTAPVATDPINGFFTGNQFSADRFAMNPNYTDYNFPGGAHGYFTVDLQSVPADQPYVYFDYVLQTENEATNEARSGGYSDDFQYPGSRANTPDDPLRFPRTTMRDAFRVYGTSVANPGPDDWLLLATNNSATIFESGRPARRAFPNEFETPTFSNFPDRLGNIQELFDNTHLVPDADSRDAQVRQARVSLADLAGSNVTLRFEFSTEGTFNEGLSGDAFGDYLTETFRQGTDGQTDNQAAEDDALPFKVSVGNLTLISGERGWQFNGEVTAAVDGQRTPTTPDYFANPEYIGSRATGNYQIYIRPAVHEGLFTNDLYNTDDILAANDPNSTGLGDDNRFRDQGQLILRSNQISHSEEHGILITESPRLPVGAADLLAENTTRLVRGAVIENNLIADSGLAGIRFDGDPTGNGAIRFGRMINNTVVGSTDPQTAGDGIVVGPNASPTLMNNIVAYTDTALSIHASSGSTVVSGQLLHGNAVNGPLGTSSILSMPVPNIDGSDGLFRNPAAGNFLLVSGARAIDSSVNSQDDRPSITAVLSSLGINFQSPILAPDRDVLGQLRIDDPTVQSQSTKDRGAFERADNAGPRAEFLAPADNGPEDRDDDLFEISTQGLSLGFFEIGLSDVDFSGNDLNGVGVDDATVTAATVSVFRDQLPLQQGVDYNFSYDSTSNLIRLIPGPGVWIPGVYEVELTASAILDLAGNALLSNSGGGLTTFIVGVDRDAVVGSGNSWHNDAHPADVNNDGFVVAQDVNIIITEINLRQFSDPLTGRLQTPASPPPFYDVNNDGFVVALDANIIITEINLGPSAGLLAGGGTSGGATAPLSATVSSDLSQLPVDVALRSMGTMSSRTTDLKPGGEWFSDREESSAIDAIFADWA